MLKSLEELVNIIRDRKNSNSEKSYTNKLLNDKKMNVAKVNEEVKELIEAIEKNDNQVHEAADVLYHLLVFCSTDSINSPISSLTLSKLNFLSFNSLFV